MKKMITIQAAQASTGIILAEDFSWHTQQPGQKPFLREFESEAEARLFCTGEFQNHDNIEFRMTLEDGTSMRITPDEKE